MVKEKRDDDPGDGPDYCVVLETDSESYHDTSIIEKDLTFEDAKRLRDSVPRSYNGQERRIRKTPKRDWEV
jgi:hypothetical protein